MVQFFATLILNSFECLLSEEKHLGVAETSRCTTALT